MTSKKHPDVENALKHLQSVDLGKAKIMVCLASVRERGNVPEIQLLPITEELARQFVEVVDEAIKFCTDEDTVLRNYDGASKPDSHEVEFLFPSKHPVIKSQLKELTSVADLALFKLEEEFSRGLKFYLLIVQPVSGKEIYCFRAYSQKKELSRSKLFGAIFAEGHFDTIRRPTLLFDQHIDCLATGDVMLILKQNNFHRIFQFFEEIVAAAAETLKAIKAHVPISNFEEFEAACQGHFQKLAKLRNIAQKPYLAKISVGQLKKVISEFDLSIKLKKVDGKEMLSFDKSDKWALLRLLDDDYLSSLMTKQKYEVTGKRTHE